MRAVALASHGLGLFLLERALGSGRQWRVAWRPQPPSLHYWTRTGREAGSHEEATGSEKQKPAGHRGHTHHTSQLGGRGRDGAGGGRAVALRLPQPCRPETGPPNPALLPPTLPSVRPPKCCDCHSSDPADGVRALPARVGTGQGSREAGSPGRGQVGRWVPASAWRSSLPRT